MYMLIGSSNNCVVLNGRRKKGGRVTSVVACGLSKGDALSLSPPTPHDLENLY